MVKSPFKKATLCLFIVIALLALGKSRAEAQFNDLGLGSIVPWKSVETFFGPLFPPTGIGNTFRSEFGIGVSTPIFNSITLKRGNGVKYGLLVNEPVTEKDVNNNVSSEPIIVGRSLDGGPVTYDFFAKFRVWRFAGKIDYSIFESRSRRADRGGFFFNSVILSGEIDVIQGPWLAVGLNTQWFMNKPYFKFNRFPTSYIDYHEDENTRVNIDFDADAPATIGPYIRYVPPEILGFPVHFEAFYYFPLKGSPWTSYGANLVFRPQIYRFDLFSRLKFERAWFSFATKDRPADTSWELDLCWNLYGIEFGIFF